MRAGRQHLGTLYTSTYVPSARARAIGLAADIVGRLQVQMSASRLSGQTTVGVRELSLRVLSHHYAGTRDHVGQPQARS